MTSATDRRLLSNVFGYALYLIFFEFGLKGSIAFNLEPESYKLFEDPLIDGFSWLRDTYFGYSVALHKYPKDDSAWLLVGAPRANSSYLDTRDVLEPGTIFKCNIQDLSCEELWIDQEKNQGDKYYKEHKNNTWLGASLDTPAMHDGGRQALGVCAPGWIKLFRNDSQMNGACYWMNSSLPNGPAHKRLPLVDIDKQTVVSGDNNNLYYFMNGQAGISLSMADDPSEMIIGAPGVFNWKGSVIRLRDPQESRRRRQVEPGNDIEESKMFSQRDFFNPDDVNEIDDFSLNGYAVTSGDFFKKGERLYASGAPRGNISYGKVLIFAYPDSKERPLDVRTVLTGSQIGENFGTALVSADVNGDGLSDLIVGCPTYFKDCDSAVGKIEVFLGTQDNNMKNTGSRYGSLSPSAHFGITLSALGDLNRDSFQDVAVGAPWENDWSGAVYIYLGSEDGLRQTYSQRLSPQNFPSISLRGFGIGISRGTDIDNDGYPDLAIGSFLSSHAIVLRSRTVANLSGLLSSVPSAIPEGTEDDTELKLKACVTYDGYNVPKIAEIQAKIVLDDKNMFPRATFQDGSPKVELNFTTDGAMCKEFDISVQVMKLDPMRPLNIRMDYWLVDKPGNRTSLGKTDPAAKKSTRHVIGLETDCDADGNSTCSTNMTVKAAFINYGEGQKFPIGSKESPLMKITVENFGESVYLPNITVEVPEPFALFFPKSHSCDFPNRGRQTLICQMKSPIKIGDKDVLEVRIDADEAEDTTANELVVHVKAAGEGIELEPADDVISQKLQLMAKANLELRGSDEPYFYRIGEGKINTTMSKSSFVQQYTLIKTGPSPVEDVELIVDIPVNFNGEEIITLHSPEMEPKDEPCRSEGLIGWLHDGTNQTDDLYDATGQDVNVTDWSPRSTTGTEKTEFACNSDLVSCQRYVCNLHSLPGGSYSSKFSVDMVIDLTVLEKYISPKAGAIIVSTATAKITSIRQDLEFQGKRNVTKQARTEILPTSMAKKGVPWWVIFLTVLISFLLLAIIVFVLYKKGFFRRKKREEMKAHRAFLVSPGGVEVTRPTEVARNSVRLSTVN